MASFSTTYFTVTLIWTVLFRWRQRTNASGVPYNENVAVTVHCGNVSDVSKL